MRLSLSAILLALLALPLAATAETVTVEVTNNQPAGGFSFTPLWAAFHDGTFDIFNSGSPASAGLELIAELGDASGLTAQLGSNGVAGMVGSPGAPPPFTPGESGSMMFNVGDATANRYFSYGAMVIPSNDLFIGNDAPMAYEIFDAGGSFLGPVTIMIFSDNVWDAGTEMNDLASGPAFVVGQNAMDGTDENGVVTPLYEVMGADTYLASIVGAETPIGPITDGLHRGELVATISIVPEPSTLALALFGSVLAIRRRR